MQKLRKLCTLIRPKSAEKRSNAMSLDVAAGSQAVAKKAKVLRAAPSDASLDDNAA